MANPIVTGYSTNDYFYTHTDTTGECNTSNEKCQKNQTHATELEQKHTTSSATQNKYNDTLMLYNRELIITVNMILGICGLVYYIYVNKDVLPAVPTSMPEIKMPDIKMPDIKMPEMPKALPVSK
jgi:hypothetical protein